MKIFLRIFISLLVSVVCLYFATRNVEWDKLKAIMSEARMAPIFWVFLISLVTFYLRALRWQILLSPFKKIESMKLMRWQIGALLINNFLPLRMGEISRAYWAGHKTSLPKSTIFATIVLERILDLISLAAITLSLLILTGLNRSPLLSPPRLIGAAVVAAVLGFAGIKALKRMGRRVLSEKINKIFPEKLSAVLHKFAEGLKIFADKRAVLKLLVLSPIIWSIDIAGVAIFSRSLELNLSWVQAGLTMGGLILGVMIPAAPGAAGTYEAGGVAALTLLGFEKTLALSFVFLLHAFQYIFTIFLGVPVLFIEGFNPKEMLKQAQEEDKA